MTTIRLISFDQSTAATGYAIFDYEEKRLLYWGVLKPSRKLFHIEDKICDMVWQIAHVSKEWQGTFFAYEGLYMGLSKKTTIILSMLAGALVYALKQVNRGNCIIIPVTAKTWKSYCGIKGKNRQEQKPNTALFVQEKFGVTASEDECDAIAQGWAVVNMTTVKEVSEDNRDVQFG